jgi:hypothetical protein
MNKKTIVAASIVVVALSGCAQMGMFAAGNVTNVQLSAPNYEIVAVGVSGSAKASYLLGVTYSNGPQAGSVALARIGGTGQMYKEAMENLWKDFEEKQGPVEARRLALTNVRYDTDSHNFLLYSDMKLAIRADVIEFTD